MQQPVPRTAVCR